MAPEARRERSPEPLAVTVGGGQSCSADDRKTNHDCFFRSAVALDRLGIFRHFVEARECEGSGWLVCTGLGGDGAVAPPIRRGCGRSNVEVLDDDGSPLME